MCYDLSRLKEKRVSVRFVSVAFLVLTWININKCSLLAKMMTKFNKDMYAQMRNKKDGPLSAIRTKFVRIADRGAPILMALPSSPTPVMVGMASPTPSIEELTPCDKRLRVRDK